MSASLLSQQQRNTLGIVAIGLGLMLFVPFDTGGNTIFWGPFFDAGHFGLFCAITFCVCMALPLLSKLINRSLPPLVLNPILLMAAFCVGSEVLQPLFGRDASWIDLWNGMLGIAFGGVFHGVWTRSRTWWPILLTAAAAIAFQLVLLSPLIPVWHAIQFRNAQFPVLGTFEHPDERILWEAIEQRNLDGRVRIRRRTASAITESGSWSGSRSRTIESEYGMYSGVAFAAGDTSWRPYQALVFTVFNPGTPFELYIRIDDNQGCKTPEDRYSGKVLVDFGLQEVMIPISDIERGPVSRLLNLDRVRRLILFVDEYETERTFGIDDVKLQ